MGISNLFDFLGRAAAPAANVLASHNEADARETDKLRQQALALVAQQNADAKSRRDDALAQSLMGRRGFQNEKDARLPDIPVTYKTNDANEYVGLPTKMAVPHPQAAQLPGVQVTGQPSAPPQQVPQAPAGIPTGIKAPGKPIPRIDPLSPAGLAADSTKAANRAGLRPPARIDPNSQAGISADSTKAVNRAAVRPAGGMTGGMGSGGIGGVARTSAAITGMETAHNQMVPYENAVKQGTAKYDGLDYWKGLRGKMYDAKGVVNEGVHSAVFADLDKNNPDLANYLRAGETWALEDSQLSGKASDFRTKLDAFISAIGPSAGGTHIDNTQNFRATRLAELKKFQPAMQRMADRIIGTTGGNAPPNAPGTDSPTGKPGNFSLGEPDAAPKGTHTVTINGKSYRVPD